MIDNNIIPNSALDKAFRAVEGMKPTSRGKKLTERQLEGLRAKLITNNRDIFREMEAGKTTRVTK